MSDVLEYKCPHCGGAVEYSSKLKKLSCQYCGSSFSVEEMKTKDEAPKSATPEDINWEEKTSSWNSGETDTLAAFTCEACGGELVTDQNTVATGCPFCGNPAVIRGRVSAALKPDWIIPFGLDKETAKAALGKHTRGKILLPKVFKDENHLDEVKGIYVPFWLFGCDTNANIEFRATRTRHWSDSTHDYTETSYYNILRGGQIAFDNVPADGSTKMPDDMMESIEPFDIGGATEFQTGYLAGFFADKYDVAAEDLKGRAYSRIKNSVESAFADTVVGYDSVTVHSSGIDISNGTVKYALFPVWMLNTSWKEKKFIFAMNGQTGKLVGDLPMDWGSFWLWYFIVFAITFAISFGIGLLSG